MKATRRHARRARSKKPAILVCIVGLVLLAALGLFHADPAGGPPWQSRYPELLDVDESLLGRIRDHLAGSRRFEEILGELEGRSEDDPFTVLAVLMESHWEADGPRHAFLQELWFGGWLQKRASPTLDDLLLRMVRDGDVSTALRTSAAVALCRRGRDHVVAPLAAIARDSHEVLSLRWAIVDGLPDIGVPLSAHLEELHWYPLHSLHHAAAVAIAESGEPLPPALIRDALREGWGETSPLDVNLREAVRTLARDDDVLGAAMRAHGESLPFALADAVDDWISRHPPKRVSPLERARAEYRDSERYRRERSTTTLDEILAADEAELDLAGCALALEPVPDEIRDAYRDVNLDRLMRITHVLRREIAGRTRPAEILPILERHLLRGRRDMAEYPFRRGEHALLVGAERPSSRLGMVLGYGAGDSLGNALLYLAVAERLDLPLRAIHVGDRVFVRWDDGETRQIVETDAGGRWRDHEGFRIEDGRAPAGADGRELGTRQVLSTVLGRLAEGALENGRRPAQVRGRRAFDRADAAVRLDPGNGLAYRSRARARLMLPEPDLGAALEDVRATLTIRPDWPDALLHETRLLLALDSPKRALASVEGALALVPEHRRATLLRIEVLLALRRFEEALAASERGLETEPGNRDFHRLRLLARVSLRQDGWREFLPKMVSRWSGNAGIHLDVAAALLAPGADGETAPAQALAVLAEVPDLHWWKTELVKGEDGEVRVLFLDGQGEHRMGPDRWRELRRRYWELKVTALVATGRTAEAEEADRRLGELLGEGD